MAGAFALPPLQAAARTFSEAHQRSGGDSPSLALPQVRVVMGVVDAIQGRREPGVSVSGSIWVATSLEPESVRAVYTDMFRLLQEHAPAELERLARGTASIWVGSAELGVATALQRAPGHTETLWPEAEPPLATFLTAVVTTHENDHHLFYEEAFRRVLSMNRDPLFDLTMNLPCTELAHPAIPNPSPMNTVAEAFGYHHGAMIGRALLRGMTLDGDALADARQLIAECTQTAREVLALTRLPQAAPIADLFRDELAALGRELEATP